MGTQKNHLCEMILLSTHNTVFAGEKMIAYINDRSEILSRLELWIQKPPEIKVKYLPR